MGHRIDIGDYHVDDNSKRILATLYQQRMDAADDEDVDAAMLNAELVQECDFERYNRVTSRADNHLIPAGLVEETEPTGKPREFVLTDDGVEFVKEHDLDVPTLAEVRELAREAHETAESARESADRFRKEVSEVRREAPTLRSLQNQFDEFEDLISPPEQDETAADTIMMQNYSSVGVLEHDVRQMETKHTRLSARLDSFDDRLDGFESRMERLEDSIDQVERAAKNAQDTAHTAMQVASVSGAQESDPESPNEPEQRPTERDLQSGPLSDAASDDSGWMSRLPSAPRPSWRQVFVFFLLTVILLFVALVWLPTALQALDPFLSSLAIGEGLYLFKTPIRDGFSKPVTGNITMTRTPWHPETEYSLLRSKTPVDVDGYKMGEPTGEVQCHECDAVAENIDELPHDQEYSQRYVKSDF